MHYQQDATVYCPYCGELIDVLVDASAGEQSYYEDCSVCCAPILFVLCTDEAGQIQVTAKRDDD